MFSESIWFFSSNSLSFIHRKQPKLSFYPAFNVTFFSFCVLIDACVLQMYIWQEWKALCSTSPQERKKNKIV